MQRRVKDQLNIFFHLSVFDDNEAKAELKRLQNDFVIVPIDKAANNIAFICKNK